MKIYDISQEVFSCVVYPGDTVPEMKKVKRMEDGEVYNLTDFYMCAHNGTHIDSPFHFFKDGKTVEQLCLEKMVGYCAVVSHSGEMTAEDAENILKTASSYGEDATKRIVVKGESVISLSAAKVFAESGIWLIGVESQFVGPENAPMAVHKCLLGTEAVLLEGLRLGEVQDGKYILSAAPINLAGIDGAPCRALLIEM
ncbi:MAG: cyclase family protein [Eubacteriaceae bacterium]|nr:cyclase family protein [Eubacteriaceae bacterium]